MSNRYNSAIVTTTQCDGDRHWGGKPALSAGQFLNQDTVMMQLDMAVMNAFKMLHILSQILGSKTFL